MPKNEFTGPMEVRIFTLPFDQTTESFPDELVTAPTGISISEAVTYA